MRLGPVLGRKQQMIKFKGTTLYPPAIYDVLNEIEGIENYLVEVSTNELGTDQIKILAGSERTDDKFNKKIKDHFRAKLRVAPELEFRTQKEIAKLQLSENSRKPIIFIDRRTN